MTRLVAWALARELGTCDRILPASIVEGEARTLAEYLAGYDPDAAETVRRVPRATHDRDVMAERERRVAAMHARDVRPWRVAR